MSARGAALAWTCASMLAVIAQLPYAGNGFFHTWQYAALLLLGMVAATRSAARAGVDRGLLVTLIGGSLVTAAGAASGLLGADTETLVRYPGAVAPLADLRLAAFFPSVDAAALGDPRLGVTLRRKDAPAIVLPPGGSRYEGAALLHVERRVAAYVEARDRRGEHLTVTQPAGAAFLSPVLLFTRTEQFDGKALPLDTFALPALRRVVRAIYFAPAQTATFKNAGAAAGKAAILFAFGDERGAIGRNAIVLGTSGQEVEAGAVRLRAVIGAYPALVIAAAPHPLPLVLGSVLFVAGLAIPRVARKPSAQAEMEAAW